MTQLEKMARAAYEEQRMPGDLLYDELTFEQAEVWRSMQRAALKATREPGDATRDAGHWAHWDEGCWNDGASPGRIFTAMIDHILSEGDGLSDWINAKRWAFHFLFSPPLTTDRPACMRITKVPRVARKRAWH